MPEFSLVLAFHAEGREVRSMFLLLCVCPGIARAATGPLPLFSRVYQLMCTSRCCSALVFVKRFEIL